MAVFPVLGRAVGVLFVKSGCIVVHTIIHQQFRDKR